jgi:predicted SnoaL-like aldol condensation-catalyzing enzyme
MKKIILAAAISLLLTGAAALAQQANPAPGCTATPAQLEANKKVALEFFRPGADRLALADPSYKQHNPAFKKRAEDNKVTDYEEFKAAFAGGRGGGRGPATGPTPPPGNPLEVVTAECDIVTVVHKNFRQDPTAEPGKFYEAFTFDTFRIKDGKLVEHWDSALINPPAPAGR